jgi:hypothetical protein
MVDKRRTKDSIEKENNTLKNELMECNSKRQVLVNKVQNASSLTAQDVNEIKEASRRCSTLPDKEYFKRKFDDIDLDHQRDHNNLQMVHDSLISASGRPWISFLIVLILLTFGFYILYLVIPLVNGDIRVYWTTVGLISLLFILGIFGSFVIQSKKHRGATIRRIL